MLKYVNVSNETLDWVTDWTKVQSKIKSSHRWKIKQELSGQKHSLHFCPCLDLQGFRRRVWWGQTMTSLHCNEPLIQQKTTSWCHLSWWADNEQILISGLSLLYSNIRMYCTNVSETLCSLWSSSLSSGRTVRVDQTQWEWVSVTASSETDHTGWETFKEQRRRMSDIRQLMENPAGEMKESCEGESDRWARPRLLIKVLLLADWCRLHWDWKQGKPLCAAPLKQMWGFKQDGTWSRAALGNIQVDGKEHSWKSQTEEVWEQKALQWHCG